MIFILQFYNSHKTNKIMRKYFLLQFCMGCYFYLWIIKRPNDVNFFSGVTCLTSPLITFVCLLLLLLSLLYGNYLIDIWVHVLSDSFWKRIYFSGKNYDNLPRAILERIIILYLCFVHTVWCNEHLIH